MKRIGRCFFLLISVSILLVSMASSIFAVSLATSLVALDSAVGTISLSTQGGQKIIEDSFGKHIAVYVDSTGKLAIVFANRDPVQSGAWSAPIKSPAPIVSYARPAAVLVASNSLRIIAEGGTGAGHLVDVSIALSRDIDGNIVDVSYGTRMTLDSSGLAAYPAAILAHDGSLITIWNSKRSGQFSNVVGLRWTPGGSWSSVSNTGSSTPDSIIVDTANTVTIFPNIIERPDNFKLYVIANRGASSSQTNLVFNSATFNGSNWNWGTQNLAYVTNSSRGLEDATDMTWDPFTNRVLVLFDITGKNIYGVIALNSQDQTTRLDTPTLAMTNNEWGAIRVDPETGDYYIFMMDTPSGGSSNYGQVKYTTSTNGAWNPALTSIDSDTNNFGIAASRTARVGLELLYSEGISAPAIIKFARLSSSPGPSPRPSAITLGAVPNPSLTGETVSLSGTLSDATNGTGLSSRTVELHRSLDLSSWTTMATVTTEANGSYTFSTAFSTPATYYLRAVFSGDSSYQAGVSKTVNQNVISGVPASYLIAGNGGSLYSFDETSLGRIAVPTASDLLDVKWRNDGAYALVTGKHATLLKYDGQSLTTVPTGLSSGVNLYTISWKSDDSEAWIAGSGGTVIKYDGQTVTRITTGISGTILSLEWNPSGSMAILSGRNGLVATFDGTVFTVILPGTSVNLWAVDWHPSGGYALIGGADATLLRYDGQTLTRVDTQGLFVGDPHQINSIRFNKVSGIALITGNQGLVLFYNQGTLTRLRTYTDMSGNIVDLHKIGNLHKNTWGPGTDIAYAVGSNGAVVRISHSLLKVVLVSQGATTNTFKGIDLR